MQKFAASLNTKLIEWALQGTEKASDLVDEFRLAYHYNFRSC